LGWRRAGGGGGWDMSQPSKASEDELPLAGPICLAFSGAGLHGFYFNGVCQYIHEQEIQVREAWGSSAGALAALSALMRVGPEAYETVFALYDTNYHHVPWILWHGRDFAWEGPDGGIRKYMPRGPEAEAAWLENVVNGRLHIVVTKIAGWRFERVVVNHWTSVEDLIGCVRATMTIPGITAARPFRWRGDCWVDGGFMDQHPSTDKAVLVSTSLPFQPWANSWHRHVDIFRHLPLRMANWHGPVSGRRDMFKLGFMDAKAYFEGAVGGRPRPTKPLRPRARAARYLLNMGLELLQGSFMLALTARFVWSRKALWRRLIPGLSSPGGSTLGRRAQAPLALALLRACLRRAGLLAEVVGFAAASCALWFSTVDLRLDLSEHLLDLAGIGFGRRRLQGFSSSGRLPSDPESPARTMERTRRARSQPSRARRA